MFVAGMYNSEVVTLLDSIMLAILSMVCVVEISIFSHRFRSVLTTLGAINEVRERGTVGMTALYAHRARESRHDSCS